MNLYHLPIEDNSTAQPPKKELLYEPEPEPGVSLRINKAKRTERPVSEQSESVGPNIIPIQMIPTLVGRCQQRIAVPLMRLRLYLMLDLRGPAENLHTFKIIISQQPLSTLHTLPNTALLHCITTPGIVGLRQTDSTKL